MTLPRSGSCYPLRMLLLHGVMRELLYRWVCFTIGSVYGNCCVAQAALARCCLSISPPLAVYVAVCVLSNTDCGRRRAGAAYTSKVCVCVAAEHCSSGVGVLRPYHQMASCMYCQSFTPCTAAAACFRVICGLQSGSGSAEDVQSLVQMFSQIAIQAESREQVAGGGQPSACLFG